MTFDREQYDAFLSDKHKNAPPAGFEVDPAELNPMLKPFQAEATAWAVRRGRSLLAEGCGLGKTFQFLEWGRVVCEHTGGKVLALTPLGVSRQTIREAEKFGIKASVSIAKDQSEARSQITVTNYERLHLFDADAYAGVILDEGGILKSFDGKTKKDLCDRFRFTPYKLSCTATPAPNDITEIGNQAEFLGAMSRQEMLAMYFIHDGSKTSEWRLKRHGVEKFWRWVASWALFINTPSDIGHSDEGYILPPLNITEHVVESNSVPSGMLFNPGVNVSATTVHTEKRASLPERVAKVAELCKDIDRPFAVWCDTDYEADALAKAIPDAIEVRGSHPTAYKEAAIDWFVGTLCDCKLKSFKKSKGKKDYAASEAICTCGGIRTRRPLISKSDIFGWGQNFQHAHDMTWFAGYSFEKAYQTFRRMWRFGQTEQVNIMIVLSADEESIKRAWDAKAAQDASMRSNMSAMMRAGMMEELKNTQKKVYAKAEAGIVLPTWLQRRTA